MRGKLCTSRKVYFSAFLDMYHEIKVYDIAEILRELSLIKNPSNLIDGFFMLSIKFISFLMLYLAVLRGLNAFSHIRLPCLNVKTPKGFNLIV